MEETRELTNETKMSLISKVFWTLFALFLTFFLILGGIKVFRDNSPSELSQRFVRNNEIIQEKSGGIFKVSNFKKGVFSGNLREMTGTVYGNKSNLQVVVYFVCSEGNSDSAAGCNITGAKYKNETDTMEDWKEIEIDWMEKFLLTYKR